MNHGGIRRHQPRSAPLVVFALALLAIACAPTQSAVEGAAELGIDPAAVVDLGTAAVGPSVGADGRVSLLAVHQRDGRWVASPLTSSPGVVGTDSLHLLSWSGATGEEWNTMVFGTAAPGTSRVELEGFPHQRGGTVVHGAWVIALREKDLGPSDMKWRFIDADGTVRTGTGIFPPDA
jgi:hypothetical protein